MASLLSYGAGILAGDIGANLEATLGVPGPLAGWSHVNLPAEGVDEPRPAEGDFLSLVTREDDDVDGADADMLDGDGVSRRPVRQLLGVDSPSGSPGSASVHLPQTVLQVIATSLEADVVVMAVLLPPPGPTVADMAQAADEAAAAAGAPPAPAPLFPGAVFSPVALAFGAHSLGAEASADRSGEFGACASSGGDVSGHGESGGLCSREGMGRSSGAGFPGGGRGGEEDAGRCDSRDEGGGRGGGRGSGRGSARGRGQEMEVVRVAESILSTPKGVVPEMVPFCRRMMKACKRHKVIMLPVPHPLRPFSPP
ncbi:unnamed protein product [Closterium sp. NIES-54]